MQLTGAEVMVKCLEEEGVSTIFGYPGGAILPFYNALRDVKNIKPAARLACAVLPPVPVRRIS